MAILISMVLLVACRPQEIAVSPIVTVPSNTVVEGNDAIADNDQTDVDANVLGVHPAHALEATYSDEEVGFSFNYPWDWYIQTIRVPVVYSHTMAG